MEDCPISGCYWVRSVKTAWSLNCGANVVIRQNWERCYQTDACGVRLQLYANSDGYPPTGTDTLLKSLNVTDVQLGGSWKMAALTATLAKMPLIKVLSATEIGLTALPPNTAWAGMTHLKHLDLSWNAITSLPSGWLSPLSSTLRSITLNHNAITVLQANTISQLTLLRELSLTDNLVTIVKKGALAGASALQTLSLARNHVVSLAQGAFDDATALRDLYLDDNALSALEPALLQGQSQLVALNLRANRLTSIPSTLLTNISMLEELDISHNKLTQLQTSLFAPAAKLQHLDVSDNDIAAIPLDLSQALPALLSLDLSNNHIRTLGPDVFKEFGQLVFIDLSFNRMLTISSGSFNGLHSLVNLAIHVNELYEFLPSMLLSDCPKLERLDLAANKLLEFDGPALQTVVPNIKALVLDRNHLTHLVIANLTKLTLLDASSNRLTHIYTSEDMHITHANVSYNQNLHHLDILGLVEGLDVSNTAVTVNGVARLGRARLVVKHMLHPSWKAGNVLLRLFNAPARTLLDVSGMSDLHNVAAIRSAVSRYFCVNPNDVKPGLNYLDPSFQGASGLGTYAVLQVPTLVMSEGPTTCILEVSSQVVYQEIKGLLLFNGVLPTARYSCSCVVGYHEKDGLCEANVAWILHPANTALIVLVSLGVLGLIGVKVVRRFRGRVRIMHGELELRERLLGAATEDLQALKRAWEISASEVRLVKRIDVDSLGAYGAVWRGDWDGMPVAIKVLHAQLQEFDATSAEEFAKEADFLMRARHPNLVRFFGAGQLPDGTPFIVLELVARGSLRSLLEAARSSTSGQQGGADAEPSQSAAKTPPVVLSEALKRQLTVDVARGMAYIHQLGNMHRDLKTGNVLVTEGWRAKVADFGSIRGLIMGPGATKDSTRTHGTADADTDNAADSGGSAGASPASSANASRGSHRSWPDSQTSGSLTVGVGTPLYMAPEVIRGEAYGPPADVWSFGVVLWELVEEREPDLLAQVGDVGRGPLMSRLQRQLERGARLRLGSSAPEWAASLITKCFMADPSARPPFSQLLSQLGETVAANQGAADFAELAI